MTKRIMAGVGAQEGIGPVAAALMTGERRAIPKESLASMRDSGLAHLLAISSLHIGLVAGLLFFAIRLGLALIEPVALRYPIKKMAALGAVLGAFAYLLILGATIPTQRAFLMVPIVMLAVMIDRTAISMGLVALSAMAVLLLAPESLLSAPFPIYHFNRIALYGLLANLVAVPVMAMWIMPLGILSFLLMPLRLESLGLVRMGLGISTVFWIADGVAALPGAVALVSPMPTAGLAILSLGGIWACVLRGPIRFYGLPAVAAGLVSILAVSAPDVIINRDGGLVAINLGAGRLVMSPGAGNSFQRDMWQRRFAVEEVSPWPSGGIVSTAPIGCDPARLYFGD